MLGKQKIRILPLALIGAVAALSAVSIGLMAGESDNSPTAPPPSPPIAACAHKNTSPSVSVAPTCADDGVTSYSCDYCHTVVRTEPIPALGHDYTDAETSGLCTVCDRKICSPGLTYEPAADGTYFVVSKKNEVPDGTQLIDLVIPEYHDGKPVKEIANDAFVEQKYIKSVSIPSTMEYIGVGAFSTTEIRKLYFNAENCRDFVGKNWVFYCSSDAPAIDVVIGKAVRHIPDRLFYPNNSTPDVILKIKSVAFEEGSALKSIGDYAFYKTGVKSLVFPDSLETVGEQAFYGGAVEDIAFGRKMGVIGAHAFDSCDKLCAVDLSCADVKQISPSAFKNCSSVTDVKLPSGAYLIGAKAFYGCTSLTSLTLDGGEHIGDDAFYDCTSLTSVTLPAVLKTLGLRAFEGCSSLSEIVYKPTELGDLASGNRAFFGAGKESGVTVTVADGVKYIPARLFYSTADASNNIRIDKLTIPSSVTAIGDYAFRGTVIDGVVYDGGADGYARIAIGTGNGELGTPSFGKGA